MPCSFKMGDNCLPNKTPLIFNAFNSMFFIINNNNTPPKYNIEPENDGFQKESPFELVDFQVPCETSGV